MNKNSSIRSEFALLWERSEWLRDSPDGFAEGLFASASLVTADKSQMVFALEDEMGSLFGVVSGTVGVLVDDGDGGVIIGQILGSGDWFGEAGVLFDGRRRVGIVALEECRLALVPRSRFVALCDRWPEGWRALAKLSDSHTILAIRVARDLLIRSPEARCRATLERLCRGTDFPITLPITQGQLGDICRLSRAAISALLAGLEQDGIVRRGYAGLQVLKAPNE